MAGEFRDDYGWDWRSDRPSAGRDNESWSGPEDRSYRPRDRVFGERDTGAGYNQPRVPDWQDRDYEGVSPAMRQGEYEADRGPRSRGYGHEEGRRFGSREAEARYARALRRPVSRGAGGRHDERGYADAGRGQADEDFEDHAREAGEFFRRTGRKISNWFSDISEDAGGDGREAYRSHRGRGPKGFKRTDERISDDIHERLTDDHWLDARGINISVSDGEVTLSGSVDSRQAKHRAEHIVEDVAGVGHVQNNLRVADVASYTPAGSGGGSVGDGGYGAGAPTEPLREEGDAANTTSANARNKT